LSKLIFYIGEHIFYLSDNNLIVVIKMMIEVTNLRDVTVFTHKGKYLGRVEDVILDITNNKIHELLITETNGELVEQSRDVGVPYRWVKSITDIIVLRYFPGKIRIKARTDTKWKRRKQRVLKKESREHGIGRKGWR